MYYSFFRDYAQLSRNTDNDNTYSKQFEIICNGTEKSLDDCSRRTTNLCNGESAVFVCPKGKASMFHKISQTCKKFTMIF